MQFIVQWTGGHADALRKSLHMPIEAFADHLGAAPRTVAEWHARPSIIPRSVWQDALDSVLEKSPERAKARFALLIGKMETNYPSASDTLTASLHAAGINPDEQERVHEVVLAPSRVDAPSIEHLTQALYGQRHAEDSLGPTLMVDPMSAQLNMLVKVLRDTSGPHRPALMHLVGNWMNFIGWLRTALCEYPSADAKFADAEELGDELSDGVIASTGSSYRGYVALLKGNYRSAVRSTAAALATPGAHPTQLAYESLQEAQAYAGLGDRKEAKSLLHRASDLVTGAGDPPESLYWFTEPFLRLQIGMTQQAIGQHRDAVDSLSSGMAELPADQRNAEWLGEYQQALDAARADERDSDTNRSG